MTKPTRPTFMAITSTGGYIGRIYWQNSGVHPDLSRWGCVHSMPGAAGFPVWAGLYSAVAQIINWRFYEHD